jgi:ATP/maltotriose-dependent transcriptional regulator MalT/DNA-binding SARP family transcriptional activator
MGEHFVYFWRRSVIGRSRGVTGVQMAEVTEARKGGGSALEVPYPSKVALPVRRPAIVRRERLLERLRASVDQYRLTVVSAPAGYGKTTLLIDFYQASPFPVCWYSLDERDIDLQTFLRYFVAAGRSRFPAFGAELHDALVEGGTVVPEDAIDLLVAATQSVEERYIFVLDDVHFLDDCPDDLRETLQGWLYRLPHNCHVILSGRTRPQLAILPLMSVRQEVDTISYRDFSFTCDEVVHLFRDVLGKELALDDAQRLADLTEGWAAALVLMADKVKTSTALNLEKLRSSDTLFQYISLEQFDPLPSDVQEFLLGSAVLRTMEEETLHALLDISDSEEKLAFLERQNLFVQRDETRPGRFRYHRLFRAFLVSLLRARRPERFVELNLAAAGLMEAREEWEEAVYHLIQAAAWDRISQITERVGWRLFEEGRWDTLADWLDAVPEEELAGQPRLVLWKARLLHYLNQVDRALALLARSIESFEARGDHVALAEALVTKGMCLRLKGDHEEAKEALSRACALLKDHEGPAAPLTEARKELGITLSLCGERSASIKELSGVLEVYESQGDSYNIAHTSAALGVTLGIAGRLTESATHLERARQRWMKIGNDHRLVETLVNLSMTYFLQGDYENAERVAQQGLERARAIGFTRPEVYLMAALGDIRRNTGDHKGALELYQECLDLAWSLDDAFIRICLMDSIAKTYQAMGDLSSSESWASRAMAEAESRGGALELGICLVTRALLARQAGDLKEAALLLERSIEHLKEADAKRELATAYFHLAGVNFSLKKKRLALEFLELAAKLVSDLGYDHFLVLEASRNPLLIQYAAANKLADGYFARLLKMIKGTAPAGRKDAESEQAAEEASGEAVVVYGFGNPRVEVGGHEVTDLEWRSEKSKEMFFFFVCNRRPLRKEEIVAALWPDLPEDKTTSAFHSNMYRLRKALYQDCIAKDSGRYVLDPRGRFTFDVEEFQATIKAADAARGTPEAIAHLERAVSLHRGPFAPDFYSEWAETMRWQLEEQYMSALTTLAAAYSDAGEYKKSADVCQRILELDEFNEAAWYRLMANYIHSGQVEAAKYCYNRYVAIVTKEHLDEDEALPGFEEVYQEIKAGRVAA